MASDKEIKRSYEKKLNKLSKIKNINQVRKLFESEGIKIPKYLDSKNKKGLEKGIERLEKFYNKKIDKHSYNEFSWEKATKDFNKKTFSAKEKLLKEYKKMGLNNELIHELLNGGIIKTGYNELVGLQIKSINKEDLIKGYEKMYKSMENANIKPLTKEQYVKSKLDQTLKATPGQMKKDLKTQLKKTLDELNINFSKDDLKEINNHIKNLDLLQLNEGYSFLQKVINTDFIMKYLYQYTDDNGQLNDDGKSELLDILETQFRVLHSRSNLTINGDIQIIKRGK